MGKNFVEVVFEGHHDAVKGYIEGFLAGMEKNYQFYFASDWNIEAETLTEHIRDWISLGDKIHHVIMEDELFAKIDKALSTAGESGLLKFSSIKSRKPVRQASFDFEFEAFGRKYAEDIKEMLNKLPEGVSLLDYAPQEKIDTEAKGVELYSPAHEYIFQGKGSIKGPVDQIISLRTILNNYPLVEADKATLEY
jgi:hypothetical protein